jgi:hypothetical protein
MQRRSHRCLSKSEEASPPESPPHAELDRPHTPDHRRRHTTSSLWCNRTSTVALVRANLKEFFEPVEGLAMREMFETAVFPNLSDRSLALRNSPFPVRPSLTNSTRGVRFGCRRPERREAIQPVAGTSVQARSPRTTRSMRRTWSRSAGVSVDLGALHRGALGGLLAAP